MMVRTNGSGKAPRLSAGWLVIPLLAALLSASALAAPKKARDDAGALEDNIMNGVDNELKKEGKQGAFIIEIVGPDGKPIEEKRYVRGIPGQFAVSEFPHMFTLDGKTLFTAGMKLEGELNAGQSAVKVFTDADPDAGDETSYKAKSSANIQPGSYTIDPFDLAIDVEANVTAHHAALTVDGKTLKIHTTPVTFCAVDKKSGFAAPLTGLQLQFGKVNLLTNLTPQAGAYAPLTIYLPWGLDYSSSLGMFRIDETGKIQTQSESFKNGMFVQEVTLGAGKKAAPVGKGYWLMAHNLRRVFRRGEAIKFELVASGEYPGGKLPVLVKAEKTETQVGSLEMPAISGSDSRLFFVDSGKLAPGKYKLAVKSPDSHDYDFEIVEILPRTLQFQHTVNACNSAAFTVDPAGLAAMADAGATTWVSYGHGSLLGPAGPVAGIPSTGAPADAPEELKKPLTPARQILENTQHVGMQMIDYENRAAGFYNEGLAFHHSYKPTIDRQIRRVHIFGQQTEDYPAFKGFTYTWFPALGGYTEGGVCVDPYFGKRMEALQSIVKDKTGATPVPWPEWQKAFKPETSPEVRRQMTDQHRKYWKAEQHYGYYQTLNQWREKLREVDARLISTTSTNAGHDPGTLVSEMANGLDAMSFEHYTDYGDWPASMGWIVAWAKSRIGDKQLWYTIDGANQNPMLAAKAIASMAHGCEGVGLPMLAPSEKRDYAKKKIINDFLAKYGTLAFAYQPDNTVQIMGNVMDGGNYWDEHALYGALMRLGYSPNVLFEETVEAGKIPQGTRVIFLPKVKLPFSAECEASLKKFIAAGGVVATVGPNCYPFDGAKHYEFPLKGLWEVGGFWSHKDFWDEFERERPDIEKMMAELQLAPKWGSEPDKAPIYSMPAGGLQYLAVCSSVAGTIDMAFTPASGLKVKVNGAKKVINLVTQQELPVQDDAVTVDLIAEPAAFLVLLDTAPEGVKLHFPAEVKAGGTFELSADVLGDAKISAAQVPVQYTITDPAGKVRATFDRLSGKDKVQYLTAETDDVGEWTVSAQELLTGVQAQAKLKVTASSSTLNAIAQAPDVFIPHPDRLPLFLKGQGDVRVIIEETQADLEPDAQRIVDALKSAGRTAIVEKVQATSFDTVWLKWFPGPKEEKVLGQIDKGELIGYRGQLSPYVSKATSKFLPEKGGWTDVAPMYLVRNDVVLFSGGRLCVSLAAMNDWQATANFPGKAQGIVDVALSPFWADKHAISVVSNDEAGRKKAVEKLIEVIGKKGEAQQAAAFPASGVAPASNEVIGKERIALEAPMKGMVPPALVKTMTASADGHVAVELKDKTVLLSPSGEVQRITAPSLIEPSMAADGTFYGGKTVTTQLNAAWHFTTAWKVSVEVTPPSGDLKRFWLPEEFDPGDMVDGWQSAYKVSPDGKTFFAPHMGGGYTLIDLQSNISKSFNDATDKVMFYERLRDRPFVNAVQFSGDGQFVVYAASNKPTGYGGMMGPPPFPYCESLRMVNAKTGEVVWRRDVARQDGMELSAMDNAITVADQGKKVAYIDWAQNARMLDETGREIWARQLFDYKPIAGNNANANPKPLRAEFSKDATSAIFASNGHIIIADGDGGNAVALEVPALVDIHIAPDGSCFYTADADGVIGCFKRDGKQVWTKQTTGDRPRLIATDKGVLVGAGNGNLLTFDTSGNVVKTLPLADLKLDKLEFTEVKLQGPGTYREPETLSTLKKVAGARQAKAWQGEGEAKEAFGRKFYAVGAAVQLSAAGPEQHVVHLVYRHKFGGAAVKQDLNSEYGLKATIAETKTEEPKVKQPAGPAPSVTVDNGDKKLTFILDLATPEYRVVDLPCDAKTGCSVTVNPAADLEIAELSIWSFNFPGSNGLYIQPAKAGMQQTDGLDDKKSKDPDDPDTIVLDPTDNASVAKAHAGKMKNAAIFALNGDPDQVQGHYVRQTGNVMDTFDGQKFLDGKPSAWTPAKEGGFGSRMMIDMGYIAKPKLCVTYDRSLKQSEVMSAVAALKAKKTDFQGNNPDLLAFEPRVVRGVTTNDQFFNVFDVSGVDMEALCVYVAGAGTDLGLSEIELYE